MNRRDFVASLGSTGLVAAAWPARSDAPVAGVASGGRTATERLRLPGESGWFARLRLADQPLALHAGAATAPGIAPWPDAYACEHRGRRLLNPTLVVAAGERVRIEFINSLAQPSIVHWHGLANDTANDGGGLVVAAPGARYAYDFTVRDRAGLYWYHPHPHGYTAPQLYRGLFGLIEVVDDDELTLRRALDLTPGTTELALVLKDRGARDYRVDALDRHRGLLGDVALVNGSVDPVHDVATRAYRLRLLNASNARSYRLGLRNAAGKSIGFTLLGTDGGLLEAPIACDECFLSPGERIDVLVDLRGMAVGDAVVVETRAFDPMHARLPDDAPPPPDATSGMAGHATGGQPSTPSGRAHDGWPEGGPRDLLTLRVRERIAYRAVLPSRLSTLRRLDPAGARERPFRLGFNKGRWRINDRAFAMDETPIEVARDTTEVWLLRNYYTSMPHPMHLHGFHFQVLERETSPDFLSALATQPGGRLATDMGWKDTVLVWPGESVRVAVRFAMPYAGPQTYMFHCHNVEHQDGGMMLGVKVA
jgi:suppressor of ftsI/bilirubin oxidase